MLERNSDDQSRAAREKRRQRARYLRRGLVVLGLLAAAALAAFALRPKPVAVDIARVAPGRLVVAIEETGVTRVKDRFQVSAPLTGSMTRVGLEPGDFVHEGDVLTSIAPAQSPLLDERTRAQAEARVGAASSALGQANTQIARARLALRQAQQDLERVRALTASGTYSTQALDDAVFAAQLKSEELASAEFAAKVATEELRSARATLARPGGEGGGARASVLAPVSGQVLRVHQQSAGVVQAGTPLLEIGNPDSIEVVVDLLTTDAVRVEPGTPVVITRWGGEHDLNGRVRRVEPSGFTRPSALGVDEQRVNVVVALTEPRARFAELVDGYRVEARIVLWSNDGVLKIPLGATFRHGDSWAAFALVDGHARLTRIELGHRGESEAEVVGGLRAGSLVAVHPNDAVADGVRVAPR
jgi:HlyD family secretion protein